MLIESVFDFEPDARRRHLRSIAGFPRTTLQHLEADLRDNGVTYDSLQTIGATLGELATYVSEISDESSTTLCTVRAGEGPLTPIPGGGTHISGDAASPESFRQFAWSVQELVTISNGTFTLRVTKGDEGFRLLMAQSPLVVRYDSDVIFDVPDFAPAIDEAEEKRQYIDRALWSQGRAAEKFPLLRQKLDAEVPDSMDGNADSEHLDQIYRTGGFTFRISRVGAIVSVGLDREKDSVNAIRTMSESVTTDSL